MRVDLDQAKRTRRVLTWLAVGAGMLALAIAGLIAPNDDTKARSPRSPTSTAGTDRFASTGILRSTTVAERGDLVDESKSPIAPPRAADDPAAVSIAEKANPKCRVAVSVVSARGEPQAGVPIDGSVRRADGSRVASYPFGTTGEDGSPCIVDDVLARRNALAPEQKLFAELGGCWREPIAQEVIADGLDPQNIVLQLPPVGCLEVAFRDSRGPIATKSTVVVTLADRDRATATAGEACFAKQGVARFERIPLGERLRVVAHDRNDVFEPKEFEGPRFEGETVRVEFVCDDSRTVRGRLVDDARSPLPADGTISVLVRPWDGGDGYRVSPTLAPDGRFEFHFRELPTQTPARLRVEAFGRLGGRVRPCEVALPHPVPQGVTDLGDIVCEALPLVARGRVVDPEGRPIAGAVVGCAIEGKSLSLVPSTSTADDGTFSLYGDPPSAAWTLRAMRHAYTPSPPRAIEVGAQDVELRLDYTGQVRGSLLLPPQATSKHLSVSFVTSDGNRVLGKIADDGSFVIDWTPLGRGRLEIHGGLEYYAKPLRILDDVMSRNTAGMRDARLDGIVLATVARTIELRVRDPAGEPWYEFEPRWRDAGGRLLSLANVVDGGNGVQSFVVPLDLHEFAIERAGCEPFPLIGVDGPRDVVLPTASAEKTGPR